MWALRWGLVAEARATSCHVPPRRRRHRASSGASECHDAERDGTSHPPIPKSPDVIGMVLSRPLSRIPAYLDEKNRVYDSG